LGDNSINRFTKVIVEAARDVAYESADHICPWGAKRDNSRNRLFNRKLYKLFQTCSKQLTVLDIGCSGGGFVKDCIDDGCLAIGLEGSSYSKLRKRAEWATIPEFLFTCDITGDFEVLKETSEGLTRVYFDVVTAWEVIEHIAESKLSKVIENVRKHLKPSGLWILSVSPNEEVVDGFKLHLTVRPKTWWIEKFSQAGFEHLGEHVQYFNTQFVRGPKYNAPGSFHLVLSLDKNQAPPVPKEGSMKRIIDLWSGSRPQRLIKRVLS